jgi:NarL family two-component system response regulator LiaR
LVAFRVFAVLLVLKIQAMTLRKSIILYGLAMATLFGILKFAEYRFVVRDLSLELYLGLVAVLFISLGVWVGRRLTRVKIINAESEFTIDEAALKRLGITKREYEVLGLIAQGLSNQEIADSLFVSTSTVKTHTSNLFVKLEASRRTQALQKAKELKIIP